MVRHLAASVLLLGGLLGAAAPLPAASPGLVLGDGGPLLSHEPRPTVTGTASAAPGTPVVLTVEDGEGEVVSGPHEVVVGEDGAFSLRWPETLAGGSYRLRATVTGPGGQSVRAEISLVIQLEGRLPRRPLVAGEEEERSPPVLLRPEDYEAFTDRWRVTPPPYELTVEGSRWDPYNQNLLKGDLPILGQDIFLNLTAVSDTLLDGSMLPTPAGISTDQPGSIDFFGDEEQRLANQLLLLSADLFKGDTAFKPFTWRLKATLAANLNDLRVAENAVVRPDVREGTRRTRGFVAVEELFVEAKLATLSDSYDFLSVRVGSQPFVSDFRGFLFSDINLGVRLFGNLRSNRYQYNLAFFERLEKDTNSGLNTFELRDQRVAVASLYRQDFLVKGHTHQWSVHYVKDDPTFVFDKNGFLVRPDPIGSFTPHEIEATYLGWTSFGHVGRLNLDHALYYVTGRDSLNPIAGPDPVPGGGDDAVDIEAAMAAVELSVDRNWYRPKLSLLWASGDSDPTDRTARGFDAIFDNPNFAGGGFAFWNRLGIRLAGTGVGLVQRGSLLPSLKSSKDEGQPNFVNPGLLLASAGVDLELTPELKAVATVNHLRFDTTEVLELVLFQAPIDEEIGWDVSVGARWRPFLNNNVILLGGVAAFIPGRGFEDIYEDGSELLAAFTNLKLTF